MSLYKNNKHWWLLVALGSSFFLFGIQQSAEPKKRTAHFICHQAPEDETDEVIIEGCNALLSEHREDPVAYYNRGAAYHRRGNHIQALGDATAALEMLPFMVEALYLRASAAYDLSRFGDAIQDSSTILRLRPQNGDAYRLRALAKLHVSDLSGALNDFDLAIRYSPRDAVLYYQRAGLLSRLERYAEAEHDLTESISIGPTDARSWGNRCWVRFLMKRGLQEALHDCDAAIRLDPAAAYAYDSRGWIYLGLKEPRKAEADFLRALQIQPDMASAIQGLQEAKQAPRQD